MRLTFVVTFFKSLNDKWNGGCERWGWGGGVAIWLKQTLMSCFGVLMLFIFPQHELASDQSARNILIELGWGMKLSDLSLRFQLYSHMYCHMCISRQATWMHAWQKACFPKLEIMYSSRNQCWHGMGAWRKWQWRGCCSVCKYYTYLFPVVLQLNLWRYGDFTQDDAKEFGYSRWAVNTLLFTRSSYTSGS